MGFSQIAVFALIATAVVASGGFFISHFSAAQEDVDAALRNQNVLSRSQAQAALSFDDFSWNNPARTLTLTLTNTGSSTFDNGNLDVLVDGVVRNDQVQSRLVDGGTTDVWANDGQLIVVLDLSCCYAGGADRPNDAAIVTNLGTTAYWRT